MAATKSSAFSFEGAHRPLPIRLVNGAGRRFERATRRLLSLDPDSLVGAAERKVGARFEDRSFHEPLGRLVESIEADAQLSPFGRYAVREQLVDLLTQRLRIDLHVARNPDLLEVPLERPVFILGFPRTGSTFLHNLMAVDPRNRVPKLWELMNPAPIDEGRNGGEDPRLTEARDYVRDLERYSPVALKIHPMTAEGPEECRFPLERTFLGGQFIVYYRITRYMDWFVGLPDERLEGACLDVRRQMQVMKSGDPASRWVGKSTGHALFGRGLMRAFPDACVVQLLRDPVEAVPSICSLSAALRSVFSDRVDPRDMGPEALAMYVVAIERNREMREAPPPATFCEVRYENLVSDPIGVVRRIYDSAGMEMNDEVERGLERYVAEHPQHKGGVHRYTPEQFGLTREKILTAIEPHVEWLERFGR